ncbi:MAG: hypothetical protein ABIE22_02270 [archaeon]
MTRHLREYPSCNNCETIYFPFNEDHLTCPKCGEKSDFVDIRIIPEIVGAARENMAWPYFMPTTTTDLYVGVAMSLLSIMGNVKMRDCGEREMVIDTLCDLTASLVAQEVEAMAPYSKALVREITNEIFRTI